VEEHVRPRLGTRVLWLQDPLGGHIYGQGHGESLGARHIASYASIVPRMIGGYVLDDQTSRVLVQAPEHLIAVTKKLEEFEWDRKD